MKVLFRWLVLALLATCSLQAHAQQTPISRYTRLTGNINFVATGGSLRTSASSTCAVGATNAQALSGVPGGASIRAAYLYWGGSGDTPDSQVTLNGTVVNAGRTFQATFDNGTEFPFFGGFADVTTLVAGNGLYTFGGLTVATGNPHCSSSAVLAGWGLIVVYGSPTERLRAINVFDGLEFFYGSALTLTPDGFRIPASNIDGRMAIVAWEGDPGNSGTQAGADESLRFNGTTLNDGINVTGSDPLVQPYDGTINSQNVSTSYGVDVDTFDVSGLLTPGQTSATTVFSAGADLVLLTAQVVSVTSEPVVDLSISKTHSGNFSIGSNGVYTLTVSNAAGASPTDFPVTVTDALPAALSHVSAGGSGWSCGASGQNVTCTHAGPLNAGASLPPISLTVAVSGAAFPSVTNSASVTTPGNDPNTSNNVASDTAAVVDPSSPGSGTKPLYLRRTPALELSRTPPTAAETAQALGNNQTLSWVLSPALQLPTTLAVGNISIPLWLSRSPGFAPRTVEVTLTNSVTGVVGVDQQTISPPNSPTEFVFVVNNTRSTPYPAGSTFTLSIRQTSFFSLASSTQVHPNGSAGNYSHVSLNSNTVINVDNVQAFDAAYPSGAPVANLTPGQTVYLRAQVSDPFGSFDIASAAVTLVRPDTTVAINQAAMTRVADSGAATATYELAYVLPGASISGTWTANVLAIEGTEATVTDAGVGSFGVTSPPSLSVLKTAATISDPVNGAVNPKSIPGAVQMYTVRLTNQGAGVVDANSLAITDAIPADTELYVLDVAGAGSGPIAFVDGAPSSLLTYTFTALNSTTDRLEFSNDNAVTWTYTPTSTGGYDSTVTHIRVRPQGSMAGAGGSGNPSFEIRFRVRVK